MKRSILRTIVTALFAVFIFAGNAFAQNYAFMVLGTKGANSVDGNPMKVGSTLSETQEIKVGDGAYLGLAHVSGKTLEIKKKGSYKIADLVKKISTKSNSLADQYASFVISELTGGDQASNRYAKRAKTGSVTRGAHALYFTLPEKTNALKSEVTIKWDFKSDFASSASEVGSYKYTIKNIFQEVIFEGETSEMEVTLDLNDPKFKNEKQLMYTVVAKDRKGVDSPDQMLVKLKDKDSKEIEAELAQIPKDGSVFSKIAEAQVYEEKELYANAINSYEKALEIDNSGQFQNLYKAFLIRNGLSVEKSSN